MKLPIAHFAITKQGVMKKGNRNTLLYIVKYNSHLVTEENWLEYQKCMKRFNKRFVKWTKMD